MSTLSIQQRLAGFLCMRCAEPIKDEEFEYEDYFQVFRGNDPETMRGYICMDCYNYLAEKWKK